MPTDGVVKLSTIDIADIIVWKVAWPGSACARKIKGQTASDSGASAVYHLIRGNVENLSSAWTILIFYKLR
jgi:hypothetical protein